MINILFCFIALMACNDDAESRALSDRQCYVFDVRQCGADVYASEVPEDGSRAEREADMSRWLQSQGIEVVEVVLQIGFHDLVCQACDICPVGDRYFVATQEEIHDEKAEKLRLLNFAKDSCD